MEIFFSRDLFADVMSVHNRNMKHAHAIEFEKTNLLAMLWRDLQSLEAMVCPKLSSASRNHTWPTLF